MKSNDGRDVTSSTRIFSFNTRTANGSSLFVAEISFSGSPATVAKLKAFSVTSSAFYWPFFFADGEPSDYVHDSKDERTPDTFDVSDAVPMDYKAKSFTQKDNFCRIDIDRSAHQLTVCVFDSEGEPVKEGKKTLRTTLKLAAW